jgi:S1-C subfamily serine protease
MARFCILSLVFTLVCLPGLAFCDNANLAGQPVGIYLQNISVNVKAKSGQGSGTIFISEVGGKKINFVLTAYHVVEALRSVQTVIDNEGNEKKRVVYDDAVITQEHVENGRKVGEIRYDAKVICVDPRRDIALLQIRKENAISVSGTFYLDSEIPPPGTLIFHCGAPGGQEIGGSASVTGGIISRIGVSITDFGPAEHAIYDQVDCAALPGSSGGLIALQSDGRWIGMITLGLQGSDSFHWMVPVRIVKEWAKEAKIEWFIDPNLPRPSEEDLKNVPLEINPTGQIKTSRPTASKNDIETLEIDGNFTYSRVLLNGNE